MEFRDSCPTLLHELSKARQRVRHSSFAPILRTAELEDLLALPEYPPWGCAYVSAGDEFYQPEPYPDGTLALILPAIENFTLIDLLAVSLETGALRTRYGIADYLGHNALDFRRWQGEPVAVFEDPVSWLRHGGEGVFIVDWRHIVRELAGVAQLVCQTPALALRIKQAFEQAIPCPPLLVSSDRKESRHVA